MDVIQAKIEANANIMKALIDYNVAKTNIISVLIENGLPENEAIEFYKQRAEIAKTFLKGYLN